MKTEHKLSYITNDVAITLFLNGQNARLEKTDKRYPAIIKALNLPVEEQEAAVLSILNPGPLTVKSIKDQEGFEYKDGSVFYQGEELPVTLVKKVLSILEDGLPVKHFVSFWDKLHNNPSSSSVKELIDFLSYRELPLTDDGCILAYKGVQQNYYSSHGNKATKVLQGTVNSEGQIYNGVGEVIEVRRRDVDDVRQNECSHGLHVGSLDYAKGFASRMVLVKVDPADVVSVPMDCEFQKCRVCKYEVIADYVSKITSSVVDEDGEDTLVPDGSKERTEFIDRVQGYLGRKSDAGIDEVTVRQIQSAFSPAWPSKLEVLDALQDLGYSWYTDDGIVFVIV